MANRLIRKQIQDLVRDQDLPPGHAFRIFFNGWNKEGSGITEEGKKNLPFSLGPGGELLKALQARQGELLKKEDPTVLRIERNSLAPFVTGMGLPHPLENGFSFLDPYGLPYLPGSSVKGVLRRAAEELCFFEEDRKGWTVTALWELFGFEGTSAYLAGKANEWAAAFEARLKDPIEREGADAFLRALGHSLEDLPREGDCKKIHSRGALVFLDVLPNPPQGALRTDILNPHYPRYYQKGEVPTDDQNPIPNFYLTLPEGTKFTFTVLLRPSSLVSQEIRQSWKELLGAAFDFASLHLGFGGKTSQGYGRLSLEGKVPVLRLEGSPALQESRSNRSQGGRTDGRTGPRPRTQQHPPQAPPPGMGRLKALRQEVEKYEWNPDDVSKSQQNLKSLLSKIGKEKGLVKSLVEKLPKEEAARVRKENPQLFS